MDAEGWAVIIQGEPAHYVRNFFSLCSKTHGASFGYPDPGPNPCPKCARLLAKRRAAAAPVAVQGELWPVDGGQSERLAAPLVDSSRKENLE